MGKHQAIVLLLLLFSASAIRADEGMWRLERFPVETIEAKYGVRISESDRARLRGAAVRILAGGSGGTGTFASANGLILTNHHVALDCIRTSTLAEDSENYLAMGFTAPALSEELPCRRFLVQVEREAKDVTAEMDAVVVAGMTAQQIQEARQRRRSELERSCTEEKGEDFVCDVADFNSGAASLLIVYEQIQDVRLVYAPELALGYFGGDEMNFRFPRYVADVSILRAYVAPDGSHREYHEENVPFSPPSHLKVTLEGVEEGDFTLIAGFPGNTNRYRMSYSADYNVRKGIPDTIRDLEIELALLEKYAEETPAYDVLLKSRIFGLSNTLKYQRDVLAALVANDVVADLRARERELFEFLEASPEMKAEYGGVLEAQARVYAEDVEAFDDLDDALQWLQRSDLVGYASGLYQFALARAESSDADREPQFQERNWPRVRQSLLDEDPVILELQEDILARGFELALALEGDQKIEAVESRARRVGRDPRKLAEAVVSGTSVHELEKRRELIEAPVEAFERSADPAVRFARELEPVLDAARERTRVLNEKLFINRATFARAMSAWKKEELYYDANFTLRATYGQVKGYLEPEGAAVPYTTLLEGLFRLAQERGNEGDFAVPETLARWREAVGEERFEAEYAELPVNFVTTNDTTGGNSGSSVLDRNLRIVGLLFDGNEGSMASDWSYNEGFGRSIVTDIRFALFVAREVHGAVSIVEELLR